MCPGQTAVRGFTPPQQDRDLHSEWSSGKASLISCPPELWAEIHTSYGKKNSRAACSQQTEVNARSTDFSKEVK